MILRIPISLPARLVQDSCQCHVSKWTSELAIKPAHRSFTVSPTSQVKRKESRHRFTDPYAERQARAQRLANISRQEVIRKRLAEELGDPIRGITTPFVKSFDDALPPPAEPPHAFVSDTTTSDDPSQPPPSPANAQAEQHLNHFLSPEELSQSLDFSTYLSQPYIAPDRDTADVAREIASKRKHEEGDAVAREAISRIVSLANVSSQDRTRANIQRCIDTFGRHHTDLTLRPKGLSQAQLDGTATMPQPAHRGGPDTGSSEVQIGILTAKIRVLANEFEGVSRNDKVNKRNLRLLLHRRQKLLQYLKRKERGSGRWEHMVETLGLTEGTWKGQIEVR